MTPPARARWALPLILVTVVTASLASTGSAHAQQSQAEQLFAEGRDLLEKGRYAEACPKLAKSEELAPAVGTLLNLAYCWEQAGKLRSAMDAYAQAEAFAGASGEAKRAAFAKDRFAAVEPRAMKLIVRIAPPEAPGLEVKRNNIVMPKADLDRPIAVDPEDYVITASAPGRVPWRGAVIVKGESSTVTVIVPPLADIAKVAAPVTTDRGLGARRVAALGLGAVSALAIGGGIAAGFSASARYDDAAPHCTADDCDETGNRIQRGAVTQGNIATALIGLGLLAGGAGIYLWIVGAPEGDPPPAKKGSASLRVELRPLGGGLGGQF